MQIRYLLWALLLSVGPASLCSAERFSYYHEGVLGASLELHLEADDPVAARRAEATALAEIDRLAAVLSHYDPESELSRFVQSPEGQTVRLSPDLAFALAQADYWTTLSRGAFNAGVEELSQLWRRSAAAGEQPTEAQLAEAVQVVRRPHWRLAENLTTAVRTSAAPLTLNAVAKGIILDLVAERVLATDSAVQGVLVNIGGDIRVAGRIAAAVDVPSAAADAIGARPAASLELDHGAIATSGGSERYWEIGGRRYSHLIDPRNGRPLDVLVSATVIAPTAAAADALATICSVLPAEESLALVESLEGTACLLQLGDGRIASSHNWPSQLVADGESDADAAEENTEATAEETGAAEAPEQTDPMVVEFEIAGGGGGFRYRRPYVALWIEDAEGQPVRTLSLFLMQREPGPRWYRDLRRWYAADQKRMREEEGDEKLNLIKTVSKATRNPGEYRVAWDGTDDRGEELAAGVYTLLLEVAREHGSYQLMKQEFTLGEPLEAELKANREISAAKVHYKPGLLSK